MHPEVKAAQAHTDSHDGGGSDVEDLKPKPAGSSCKHDAQGGDRLFFVHSSAYEGPNGQNFHDNYLQVYRYLDGAFVEVTDEVIDKQFAMWSANQRWVRFEDIDHDGDSDIYFSGYTGDIAIYRNLGGTFRREIVLKDPGGGSMGVAFLSNPTTKCSDLVIARRDGKLARYLCRI